MCLVTVENKRNTSKIPLDVQQIYIGRGSPLGNPFPINPKQDRDKVCEMYSEYFHTQMKDKQSPVYKEMARIWRIVRTGQKIALICYCSPHRCHGDSLKEFLEYYIHNHKPK
jgi:hypothetical protein